MDDRDHRNEPAPRSTGRACPAGRRALREIADGHATLETVEATRAHAADCERCAAELRAAERLRGALDGLVAPESTRSGEDAFVASVLARLDGAPEPGSARRPLARWAAVGAAPALAAAAALALVLLRGGSDGDDPGRAADAAPGPAPGSGAVAEAMPDDAGRAEASSGDATIEFGRDAAPIDMALFAEAVADAGATAGFDPVSSYDAGDFLAALDARFASDPRRAARRVLRGETPSDLDAAAARILGPVADLQDRALIRRTLERTGAAGLRATATRDAAGVEAVWRVAGGEGRLAADARAVLADLAARGAGIDPLDLAPEDTPAAAVRAVAEAAPTSAERNLERWLERGEAVWLDLWAAGPDAEGALADLLASGPDASAGARVRAAIRRRPVPAGLAPTMEALRQGAPDAAATLASLADLGGAEALIGATRSGVLRTAAEDAAWTAMIAASPRSVVEAAERAGDLAVALESLARSAGAEGLDAGGLDLALLVAEDAARPDRLRDLALLVVAESSARGDLAPARARADALRSDHAVDVAAAAWLAWIRLGGVPETPAPELARALDRGGSPSVAKLRIARALARARGGGSD